MAVTCLPWKLHSVPSLGTVAVSYFGHTVKGQGGFPWLTEESQLLKGSELGINKVRGESWGSGLQGSLGQQGGDTWALVLPHLPLSG